MAKQAFNDVVNGDPLEIVTKILEPGVRKHRAIEAAAAMGDPTAQQILNAEAKVVAWSREPNEVKRVKMILNP